MAGAGAALGIELKQLEQELSVLLVASQAVLQVLSLSGLGVMLLEIAYEAPIQSLRKPADVDANDQNTEYYTADRVRLSASKLLGTQVR